MSTVPTLGSLIRRQREIAAMTMRQLAMMSGISGPYLSQIENGLRTPSEQVLRNLAATLGMEPDDLIGNPADADLAAARDRTRSAIQKDPNLTAAQQQTLLEVYSAMAGAPVPSESPHTTDESATTDEPDGDDAAVAGA